MEFDPARKVPPKDRPQFTPNYGVPAPQIEEEQGTQKHPGTITQADIDIVSETHPDEAEKMQKLIAMSPHYQNEGDDGNSPEMAKLYEEYVKILGVIGFGSATIGIVTKTPINPLPALRNEYGITGTVFGPKGHVFGHETLGASITPWINRGRYRLGWGKHKNNALFRYGLPDKHNNGPIPFIPKVPRVKK